VDHDLALDLGAANGPHDRMVLVATEPLTRNEPWEPFAAGELRVFVDGEQVWQAAPKRLAVRVESAHGASALASVLAA
jgi:predicted glutamine amidotransferase